MEFAGLLVNIPRWIELIEAHKVERDAFETQVRTFFVAKAVEETNGDLFGAEPKSHEIKMTSQNT